MSGGNTVVIGIGNEMRGDDGAGPAVIARLRGRVDPGVTLHVLDGEPGRLIETWSGAGLAVLVDAVRTGAPTGSVHRLTDTAELGRVAGGPGTHGAGLGEAVRLGSVLGRLPRRLVVVGIEGSAFAEGPSLSPEVEQSLPVAVDVVLDEVRP